MRVRRREFLIGGLGVTAATGVAQSQQPAAQHVHDRIRSAASAAPLRMRFRGSTAAECRTWQREFHDKLAALLGDYQPPGRWETTVERTEEFDDFTRRSLLLSADGAPTLPVYLLSPKGFSGKRPGVVALHGHGPFGHDSVAGVDHTPARRDDISKFNYDFGRQLAKRGYVVAAPCFTPFGRRLDDREAYGGDDACAVSFVRLQLLGKILMAENLRDALWSFALLAGEQDVDPERIGCVGLSYGGRMTMLTSALEPRIRVAVCSGALNVMQERIQVRYSCGAQVIPGLLEYGDVPEIAGLIAPRPAVWEVGRQDPLMVREWIAPAWDRIERPYRALAALDQLRIDEFDGAHRWNGVTAYETLAATLRP